MMASTTGIRSDPVNSSSQAAASLALTSNPESPPTSLIHQSFGVGCLICGDHPVGMCENCQRFYCIRHGDRFCSTCLSAARTNTPGGLRLITWLLYLAGAFIALMMACAGSLVFGEENFLVAGVGAGLVYLIVMGLPLFLLGSALSRGSGAARGLLVVVAYLLFLLVPVGTVIGFIMLHLLNQPPTQRWFEMRKTKKQFAV